MHMMCYRSGAARSQRNKLRRIPVQYPALPPSRHSSTRVCAGTARRRQKLHPMTHTSHLRSLTHRLTLIQPARQECLLTQQQQSSAVVKGGLLRRSNKAHKGSGRGRKPHPLLQQARRRLLPCMQDCMARCTSTRLCPAQGSLLAVHTHVLCGPSETSSATNCSTASTHSTTAAAAALQLQACAAVPILSTGSACRSNDDQPTQLGHGTKPAAAVAPAKHACWQRQQLRQQQFTCWQSGLQ